MKDLWSRVLKAFILKYISFFFESTILTVRAPLSFDMGLFAGRGLARPAVLAGAGAGFAPFFKRRGLIIKIAAALKTTIDAIDTTIKLFFISPPSSNLTILTRLEIYLSRILLILEYLCREYIYLCRGIFPRFRIHPRL